MRKVHGNKPSREVERDIQLWADPPCIEEVDPWQWEGRHQFGHEPVTYRTMVLGSFLILGPNQSIGRESPSAAYAH